MDRISLSTSRFFETQPKIEELRALIDNPTNSEREAAEGMKFLLAVRRGSEASVQRRKILNHSKEGRKQRFKVTH